MDLRTSIQASDSAGAAATPVDSRVVLAAVGASIGGLLVHNLTEFPRSILLGPETLVPVAVTILLGVTLLRRPVRPLFVATAGCALVVIVVGGGSVLPLSLLPFVPEQTVGHYLVHGVYALAQLPLLLVAVRGYRRSRRLD